jgi:hypothetical protein
MLSTGLFDVGAESATATSVRKGLAIVGLVAGSIRWLGGGKTLAAILFLLAGGDALLCQRTDGPRIPGTDGLAEGANGPCIPLMKVGRDAEEEPFPRLTLMDELKDGLGVDMQPERLGRGVTVPPRFSGLDAGWMTLGDVALSFGGSTVGFC